jgi:hypothetical protein
LVRHLFGPVGNVSAQIWSSEWKGPGYLGAEFTNEINYPRFERKQQQLQQNGPVWLMSARY